MDDSPNPRPEELEETLDRLSKMLQTQRGNMDKTLADIDSLDQLTAEEAYEIGRLKGSESILRSVKGTVNDDITGIYFETREELEEAVRDRYTTEIFVSDISPSLDSDSPVISLGYSWVELPERLDGAGVESLANEIAVNEAGEDEYQVDEMPDDVTHREVPGLVEEEAIPFGDGFVVDFGPSSELRMSVKRAAEDEIGGRISP